MKKQIEQILHKALLLDGEMEFELYKYELEEHIDYWKKSLKKDKDEFIFVVNERDGDVAMLLITKSGELYINEEAREQLKAAWETASESNIERLLPHIAEELANDILSVDIIPIKMLYPLFSIQRFAEFNEFHRAKLSV